VSSALQIPIEILVTAEQQQHSGARIVLIRQQRELVLALELIHIYAGQVATLGLANFWRPHDDIDSGVNIRLLILVEFFIDS
jgi:hypothetical protein